MKYSPGQCGSAVRATAHTPKGQGYDSASRAHTSVPPFHSKKKNQQKKFLRWELVKYAVKKRYIMIREPVWAILPDRDKLRSSEWFEIKLVNKGRKSVQDWGNSRAAVPWQGEARRTAGMNACVLQAPWDQWRRGGLGGLGAPGNPTLARRLCFSLFHWVSSKDSRWKQSSAT